MLLISIGNFYSRLGGYLSTIQQHDWKVVSEQIERCIQATHQGSLPDVSSLRKDVNEGKLVDNVSENVSAINPELLTNQAQTQRTFITADPGEGVEESHQTESLKKENDTDHISLKVAPTFPPLSPRKSKGPPILLKYKISKASSIALSESVSSEILCEPSIDKTSFDSPETLSLKKIDGPPALLGAFNESLLSASCHQQFLPITSAETVPMGISQSLNIRTLYPSSDISHPKSWDHASLYQSYRRHHGPHVPEKEMYDSKTMDKSENTKIEKLPYRNSLNLKLPPETYKYVLDEEYGIFDDYTNFEPEILVEEKVQELEKSMKNHMRAGEPFLPIKVVGTQPPAAHANGRSPNIRRRAMTKQEYVDKHFSPRSPRSGIKPSAKYDVDSSSESDEEYTLKPIPPPERTPVLNYRITADEKVSKEDGEYEKDNQVNPTPPSDSKPVKPAIHRNLQVRFKEKKKGRNKNEPQVKNIIKNKVQAVSVPPTESIEPSFLPEPNPGDVIMLVESRRLMQLYFAKKFLQLDVLVDVYGSRSSAARALALSPNTFSHVFVSYNDLISTGNLRNSLNQLIDPGRAQPTEGENNNPDFDWGAWNPSIFRTSISLVVYGEIATESLSDMDIDVSDVSDSSSDDDEDDTVEDDPETREARIERREARAQMREKKLLRREEKISV